MPKATKRRKYLGYFINGQKGDWWSSAMGYDIKGKTIAEVEEKIHRLLYAGMPKSARRPRPRKRR